jgi:hypothetical protein
LDLGRELPFAEAIGRRASLGVEVSERGGEGVAELFVVESIGIGPAAVSDPGSVGALVGLAEVEPQVHAALENVSVFYAHHREPLPRFVGARFVVGDRDVNGLFGKGLQPRDVLGAESESTGVDQVEEIEIPFAADVEYGEAELVVVHEVEEFGGIDVEIPRSDLGIERIGSVGELAVHIGSADRKRRCAGREQNDGGDSVSVLHGSVLAFRRAVKILSSFPPPQNMKSAIDTTANTTTPASMPSHCGSVNRPMSPALLKNPQKRGTVSPNRKKPIMRPAM